jgi:hypothetical protein
MEIWEMMTGGDPENFVFPDSAVISGCRRLPPWSGFLKLRPVIL